MLTNLDAGRYFWSAQAIDHSFAGSAFAPEQSFVIPAAPDGPPLIDSVRSVSATELELTLIGYAGNTYALQSGTNLLQWAEVRRLQFDQHMVQITESIRTDAPVQFFRLELLP